MTFDAAIFDMDGLLLDTERRAKSAFQTTCDALGLTMDEAFYFGLIGQNQAATAAALGRWLGSAAAADDFDRRWQEGYRHLLEQEVPTKAGVTELLAHLWGVCLPCAVATSTGRALAQEKLARAGIDHFFTALVGGDQVNEGKPSPEIFLRAAAMLKAVPARCIVFEDSENGVRAALAAGMTVVQVPDLVSPSAELRGFGHAIADDLLDAARRHGLLSLAAR